MRVMSLAALGLIFASPLSAQNHAQDQKQEQEQDQPQQQDLSPLPVQTGRNASSSVGVVGQRQSAQAGVNVAPMGRVNVRIESRIQSRIASRIDRNYNPQPNSTTSFTTAADQVRIAGAGR
jgi:hypothetical protein